MKLFVYVLYIDWILIIQYIESRDYPITRKIEIMIIYGKKFNMIISPTHFFFFSFLFLSFTDYMNFLINFFFCLSTGGAAFVTSLAKFTSPFSYKYQAEKYLCH